MSAPLLLELVFIVSQSSKILTVYELFCLLLLEVFDIDFESFEGVCETTDHDLVEEKYGPAGNHEHDSLPTLNQSNGLITCEFLLFLVCKEDDSSAADTYADQATDVILWHQLLTKEED